MRLRRPPRAIPRRSSWPRRWWWQRSPQRRRRRRRRWTWRGRPWPWPWRRERRLRARQRRSCWSSTSRRRSSSRTVARSGRCKLQRSSSLARSPLRRLPPPWRGPQRWRRELPRPSCSQPRLRRCLPSQKRWRRRLRTSRQSRVSRLPRRAPSWRPRGRLSRRFRRRSPPWLRRPASLPSPLRGLRTRCFTVPSCSLLLRRPQHRYTVASRSRAPGVPRGACRCLCPWRRPARRLRRPLAMAGAEVLRRRRRVRRPAARPSDVPLRAPLRCSIG
mmetsp:Transcript_24111/g.77401  ORF Transcript_24111/g.77401 Transcript_24111/m.77401 type:complete len:274 (+) Transcript_24111:318-1139(+)